MPLQHQHHPVAPFQSRPAKDVCHAVGLGFYIRKGENMLKGMGL